MMDGHGKSDRFVVPPNSPNNAPERAAEVGEGREANQGERGRAYRAPDTEPGRRVQRARPRTSSGQTEGTQRFTALLHHVIRRGPSAGGLPRADASGGCRRRWRNMAALRGGAGDEPPGPCRTPAEERTGRSRFGVRTSRRRTGGSAPLGVPTLEDKIVQRAVVEVLNAIYEPAFLGFSYGFRPGRSPHLALDALSVGIMTKKVNWVLDADLSRFFDTLDHGWLVRFLEHRIADRRVVRLIQKWLNAGVLEDGRAHAVGGGDGAGRQYQSAPGQPLPPLRARPLGPAMAAAAGARRRRRGAFC